MRVTLGSVVQEWLDRELPYDIGGNIDILQAVDYRPIGEDVTPVKAVTTIISSPRGAKQRQKEAAHFDEHGLIRKQGIE